MFAIDLPDYRNGMTPLFLRTERLIIRSFTLEDTPTIHRILDETFGDGTLADDLNALHEREAWVEWSMLNHEWFPRMGQAPYGDRAIALQDSGELIGSVGFVPLIDAFDQLPEMAAARSGYATPEVGLFWVIDPQHQRKGYATEAARAMIDYAFAELRLKRIVATTEHSNAASQAVMRKLGMTLAVNPSPEPHGLQIVGILENTK